MFRSVFDNLPVEIILVIVDNLDPEDLLSLLCGIRWLPKLLTNQQVAQISKKSGNTILHLLVENREADLVELLLSKDSINPDPRNSWNGQTPLFCAVRKGHKEIVKLLLMNNNVNSDSKDFFGWTPLWWAAVDRHQEILKMLLTQGNANSEWKVYGQTLLSRAAQYGYREIVGILLSMDSIHDLINWKDTNESLLTDWPGVSEHDYEGVETMVHHVEMDGPGRWEAGYTRTPLLWATIRGHNEVVEMLLAVDNIDLNLVDESHLHGMAPLSYAVINGNKDVVQMLLAKSSIDLSLADPIQGKTPLSWAITKEHKEIVKMLLAMDGIDLNHVDKDDNTPLLLAVIRGHKDILEMLLAMDSIDLNPVDESGRTPLFWAEMKGYKEIVQILLKKDGVNPVSVDRFGRTPSFLSRYHYEI
jgi:ankyrin repeat protein